VQRADFEDELRERDPRARSSDYRYYLSPSERHERNEKDA
jgi:hypothetical protein